MDTIIVRERSTTALSRDEANRLERSDNFLELLSSGIVSLVRSREIPYGLKAGPFVGEAILGPELRLVIMEKSEGAARALIQWALPKDLRRASAKAPTSEKGLLLEVFAIRFLEHLGFYLRRGRQKKYLTVSERSAKPRGRLDVAGTVKLRARGCPVTLSQQVAVLSADLLPNQLLAAALNTIDKLFSLSQTAMDSVLTARMYFPLFRDVAWGEIIRSPYFRIRNLFDLVDNDRRLSTELNAALAYARPLVLHLGIFSGEGHEIPNAYFLNLETLFEEAVRQLAREVAKAGVSVTKGAASSCPLLVNLHSNYLADPDLVFKGEGTLVVADCKYKEDDGWPGHSDVYQLVSHCTAFQAKEGYLIYPGATVQKARLGSTVAGLQLWKATVRPSHLSEDIKYLLTEIGMA